MFNGVSRWNYHSGLVLGLCLFAAVGSSVGTHPATTPGDQLADLRIPFIHNTGQIANPDVTYYASTFHGAVYVNHNGEIFYLLSERDPSSRWVLKERLVNSAAR